MAHGTATRLTTRAAQIALLGGLSPAAAVDAAAREVACAPAARRLSLMLVARASREGLRVLAGAAAH